ncbi:hypothetical protein BDQ17DRAFT_1325939 [Cyathus striatus]|nr:hypothetical protein BDQ17DRAFT_1325939 [Cyathus striatus]
MITALNTFDSLDFHGFLPEDEAFWRNHQQWLVESGYLVRPRFHPDWVPPWLTNGETDYIYEDYHFLYNIALFDVIRIMDGEQMMLKRVHISRHPVEASMGQLFSSPILTSYSENHCIPFYEVLDIPDDASCMVIAMPFLLPVYELMWLVKLLTFSLNI